MRVEFTPLTPEELAMRSARPMERIVTPAGPGSGQFRFWAKPLGGDVPPADKMPVVEFVPAQPDSLVSTVRIAAMLEDPETRAGLPVRNDAVVVPQPIVAVSEVRPSPDAEAGVSKFPGVDLSSVLGNLGIMSIEEERPNANQLPADS